MSNISLLDEQLQKQARIWHLERELRQLRSKDGEVILRCNRCLGELHHPEENEKHSSFETCYTVMCEENMRLRWAISQVEWSNNTMLPTGISHPQCPVCDQVKRKGHSPDCPFEGITG